MAKWVDFRGSITYEEYKLLLDVLSGVKDPHKYDTEISDLIRKLDPTRYSESDYHPENKNE